MTVQERVRLVDVERYERRVKLRLPFRFGAVTVTELSQAVIRATIALPDGRNAAGVAAENLIAKWFDKDPGLSNAQNEDQLRQAIEIAVSLYTAHGAETPFGLYEKIYSEQIARGAALGLAPLVASFGPALLDRAILDALGQARGLSFAAMIQRNVPGVGPTRHAPDLAGFDFDRFLKALRTGSALDVRHTVGLVDPIVTADQAPANRVEDGLPETLEEVVRRYRCRYYKLKVSGDIGSDLDRLSRIADVLDRHASGYRATLDGNEQYDDVAGIGELWQRMGETPALSRLRSAVLYIEQPVKRWRALSKPVHSLAREIPLILDESDGEIGSFTEGLALGYAGISSKTCKGLYKSLLNAARAVQINAKGDGARAFLSGEDLTTLAGASVQQDLALVSLLGLTHVERNGHHFIDGMSFAPDGEQNAFVAAHPALYSRTDGPARLKIDGGRLEIGSLNCPGFAVGADLDFSAMRPMPAAPTTRILPAFAANLA